MSLWGWGAGKALPITQIAVEHTRTLHTNRLMSMHCPSYSYYLWGRNCIELSAVCVCVCVCVWCVVCVCVCVCVCVHEFSSVGGKEQS